MSSNMQVDNEESPSAEMLLEEARATLVDLGLGNISLPDSLCQSQEALWDSLGLIDAITAGASSRRAQHKRRLLDTLEKHRASVASAEPSSSSLQSAPPRARDVHIWRKAFTEPYVPSDVTTHLREYIDRVASDPRVHSKMISIIQSSGTGKTRALDHVAESVFTVPICLRAPGENGFPEGDDKVFNLLCQENYANVPRNVARSVFVQFLGAVATQAMQELDLDQQLTDPKLWKKHFQKIRERFWERVTSQCTVAEHQRHYASTETSAGAENRDTDRLYEETCLKPAIVEVRHQFAALRSRISSKKGQEATLMIYMDEGHELNKGIAVSTVTAVLVDLFSGRQTPDQRVVTVLTSTSTAMQHLAERPGALAGHYADSARFTATPVTRLAQPWSPLPWNVGLPSYMKMKGLSLEHLRPRDVRTLEFAIHRGRPMWWAVYRAGEEESGVLELALAKISGHPEPALADKQAVICARLALGFSRSPNGEAFAERMARKRMALVLYVPKHRAFLYATYGSDPMLAWGAHHAMTLTGNSGYLEELQALVDNELIERGPLGELITKYVFMRGFDVALSRLDRQAALSVTLEQFLSALDVDVGKAKACTPYLATKRGNMLGDYFGATLTIAHWLRSDKTRFGPEAAIEALLAHAALMAPPNHEGVDLMVPLALDEEKPVKRDNLLVMLIQTKNRSQARDVGLTKAGLRPFEEDNIPVVFLVHEADPGHEWRLTNRQAADDYAMHLRPTSQTTSKHDVYHLTLQGCPGSILEPAAAEKLLKAQSSLFSDSGDMAAEDILQMQPFFSELDDACRTKYETTQGASA